MRSYLAPEISPEAKPFWDAANEDRLVVATCRSCGRKHHFPRSLCPHCKSVSLEFKDVESDGVVYSFSVVEAGANRYVIAYVEIDDRVRMMTNIIDCDPADIAIGQKVRPVFVPSASGQKLVMFTPIRPKT